MGRDPDFVLTYHTKLSDEKTAKDAAYRYDPESSGNPWTWRRDTYDYFVSKCPEAEPILNWAESMGAKEIKRADVQEHGVPVMHEVNPEVLSHHIWGFLQHCLAGSAKQVFRNAERRNGLDVWRALVLEINSRTVCRRHGLRDRVQQPRQAASTADIKKALADWETLYSEYLDAGGAEMLAARHAH